MKTVSTKPGAVHSESRRLRDLQEKIDGLVQQLQLERQNRKSAETGRRDAETARDMTMKENRGMKALAVAFSVAVVLVVGLFLVLGGDDGGVPPFCDDATPANDLTAADLGKRAKVAGVVEGVAEIEQGVFLNLGGTYGEQDLAVVIWENNLNSWNVPPTTKYDGRKVAVSGVIESYRGSLQIEANSPNDVVVCP